MASTVWFLLGSCYVDLRSHGENAQLELLDSRERKWSKSGYFRRSVVEQPVVCFLAPTSPQNEQPLSSLCAAASLRHALSAKSRKDIRSPASKRADAACPREKLLKSTKFPVLEPKFAALSFHFQNGRSRARARACETLDRFNCRAVIAAFFTIR